VFPTGSAGTERIRDVAGSEGKERMMHTQPSTRVVVFDDRVLDGGLREALARSGMEVVNAADIADGTRTLRESIDPVTALFWVSLAGNTLSGLDDALLLGELLRDAPLASRHAYILVTPTPREVQQSLGRVLDRLHVTVLAAPLDRERLLSALWLALQRTRTRGAAPAIASQS
jgi:hypothetical protein